MSSLFIILSFLAGLLIGVITGINMYHQALFLSKIRKTQKYYDAVPKGDSLPNTAFRYGYNKCMMHMAGKIEDIPTPDGALVEATLTMLDT